MTPSVHDHHEDRREGDMDQQGASAGEPDTRQRVAPAMRHLQDLPHRYKRHISLTQSIIAMVTGVITILGTGYSAYRYLNPPAPPVDKGLMEALIQDGGSGGPLPGSAVDILSTSKALVATLEADPNGRVSYTLKEGTYEVRVRRDGYGEVTRAIQVTPGQNVEITIRLTTSGLPVKGLSNAVKKIIRR